MTNAGDLRIVTEKYLDGLSVEEFGRIFATHEDLSQQLIFLHYILIQPSERKMELGRVIERPSSLQEGWKYE